MKGLITFFSYDWEADQKQLLQLWLPWLDGAGDRGMGLPWELPEGEGRVECKAGG